MSNHPDVELVVRAQAGEEEAFTELYQRYYQKVYNNALCLCNNASDAQDVTMTTFETVYRCIHKLRNPEMFSLWLSRITRTECIELFRRNKDVYLDTDVLESVSCKIEKRDHKYIKNDYHRQSDQKQLAYFFQKLKPIHAETIKLMYFDQLTIPEIAKELKIPEGTVKTRLLKGRNQLKRYIHEYEKQEHIKLNFQADTIVPSTIIGFGIFQKFKSKSLVSKAKIIGISATTVTLAYVGVKDIYPQYKESQQVAEAKDTTAEPVQSNLVTSQEKPKFQKVVVGYDVYYNAETAYYGLLNWANVDGIASKSIQDCQEIQPLYQAIMDSKTHYSELLETSGWSKTFQKRITE